MEKTNPGKLQERRCVGDPQTQKNTSTAEEGGTNHSRASISQDRPQTTTQGEAAHHRKQVGEQHLSKDLGLALEGAAMSKPDPSM